MNPYFQFLDWFYSSGGATALFWIKSVAAVVSIVCFSFIVYINLLLFDMMKKRGTTVRQEVSNILAEEAEEDFGALPASVKTDVSPKWESVLNKAAAPNPSDWKLAVIEADSLMDDLLKRSGYFGATMGDRLKQLDRSKLSSLNELWEAHKIRNLIAHDPNRPVSRQEIDRAIDGYEKALGELDFMS